MRVEVTQQQYQLEEKHAGGPDRSGAAEPGQNHLSDQRLHLKQQEGTEEDRQAIVGGQSHVNFHKDPDSEQQTVQGAKLSIVTAHAFTSPPAPKRW